MVLYWSVLSCRLTIASSLRKECGGPIFNKADTLFSYVRYIIVSYSLRNDSRISQPSSSKAKIIEFDRIDTLFLALPMTIK